VSVSLFMDGCTGGLQDKMLVNVKPSPHQLMFSLNAWATVQLGVGLNLIIFPFAGECRQVFGA